MWVFRKLNDGADWVAAKVGEHPALVGGLAAGAVVATGGLAIPIVIGAAASGAVIGSMVGKEGKDDKK